MKNLFSSCIFIAILLLLSGCKKEEDSGPVDESSNWNFTANFTLNDQWSTTYVAEGIALYERTGSDFKVTASYMIGAVSHQNIVLEGKINGDNIEFTTNTLILNFEIGGTPYTEEVIFTVDPVSNSANVVTGLGTVQQRLLPDGAAQSGVYTFTATKQ